MLLKREEILAANDMAFEDVEVPEWGGTVRVRLMDGGARDAFDAWRYKYKDDHVTRMKRIRPLVCCLTMVDEDGRLLFTEDDMDVLASRSTAAIDRVFQSAFRLNKLGPQEAADAAKNSDSGQSDDSGTA